MRIFYLMHDQPTTCPICGARTDWIGDFLHTLQKMIVHECLDNRCKYIFLEIEDKEWPDA
jgi:hypothetical protein